MVYARNVRQGNKRRRRGGEKREVTQAPPLMSEMAEDGKKRCKRGNRTTYAVKKV